VFCSTRHNSNVADRSEHIARCVVSPTQELDMKIKTKIRAGRGCGGYKDL
jgi:hypothetical protein